MADWDDHTVHVHFTDNQYAMLRAQAEVEMRTMLSIVKMATMQYLAQHKVVGVKPITYAKYVRHIGQEGI